MLGYETTASDTGPRQTKLYHRCAELPRFEQEAPAGGGGKGVHPVFGGDEFGPALGLARREAETAFGDPSVLLERLDLRPRHLGVQVAGDRHATPRSAPCLSQFETELLEFPGGLHDDQVDSMVQMLDHQIQRVTLRWVKF
jgi:Carbamoyl-phosphate synthase L chain, ATP binding domain